MNETITTMRSLEGQAAEACRLLKLIANEARLLILCQLAQGRDLSVGELAASVGISGSALSQHLARLRADGLVATRRHAQTIFYRIADDKVRRLLAELKAIYCPASE